MIALTRLFLTMAAVVVSTGLIGGFLRVDAHPGHVEKKLFNGRWYNAATMDLTASKIDSPELFQFCSAPDCAAAWTATIQASINDWNAQQDTADFVPQGNYNINNDVNTWVFDEIIQPGILGIALFYNSGGTQCDPNACTYYFGDALVAHNGHVGAYGTAQSKQATMTHELGHLLSLRHESVNPAESQLYQCGQDNTGPIPVSIMGYDCINPPSVGGSGIYLVQPFDVCGVNHAYADAAFGLAGCTNSESDGDGYLDPAEFDIGTGLFDPCGFDGWPSNVSDSGASANKLDILDIVSFIAPLRRLDTSPPNVSYSARWDLAPGPAGPFPSHINVVDITTLLSATTGNPPMFGGARAFGQVCPFPP